MGISSSLNAGVMGLNANAQRLSAISDNIANSETRGYKRAVTDFTALVNPGSRPSDFDAGGVRTTTLRDVSAQGSIVATGNSTDLSVNGRGMLPVTTVAERDEPAGSRPFMLLPTGSFSKDEDGFLTTSGGIQLLGWLTDDAGEVGAVGRDGPGDLVPVSLNGFDFAPNATTRADVQVNLPASASAGDSYVMTLEYFDAVGDAHVLGFEYVSDDPSLDTWTLQVTDRATGTLVGEAALDFDRTGANAGGLAAATASTGTYDPGAGTLTIAGVAGPIELTIGAPGAASNLTQYDADFTPVSVTKNGSRIGFLERIEVDDGLLVGIYDTGYRRPLYRVPVADVTNPNGLASGSGQTFALSIDSGPVYLWDAGDGPTGGLVGYSLQESTTDVTEELTALIETQRAYSSNARIVQTVDEMLQETTNLKR